MHAGVNMHVMMHARASFLPISHSAPPRCGNQTRLTLLASYSDDGAPRQQRPRPGFQERMPRRGELPPRLQQRQQLRPSTQPQPSTPPAAGQLRYYVTCHPGLEEVVAAELSSPHIRARSVRPGKAGVSFVGDAATGYRANLWLRSAIRVLQHLADAELDPRKPAGDELYRIFMETLPWVQLLQQGQSFGVEARVRSCTRLTTSQLVVVRAKDAICDHIRDRRGAKPLPPEPGRTPDLPLYVTAFKDRVSIFRDLSGVSLHRRGYRSAMHRASLNESAAAGILYLAGWDRVCREGGNAALADPMCGSGTFLIEAALMASDTAPGLFRSWWPFQAWPDFDRQAWREAREGAASARHAPAPGVILLGNDVHAGALALAQRDVQAARVALVVKLHQGGCREWVLPHPPALVVSNPPWGQRLMGASGGEGAGGSSWGGSLASGGSSGRGSSSDGGSGGGGGGASEGEAEGLEWWDAPPGQLQEAARGQEALEGPAGLAKSWHDLSVFLKEQCGGAEAYLLSGSAEATQALRLRADRKWPLSVGGVECRLLKYSIRGRAPEAATAAAPAAAE